MPYFRASHLLRWPMLCGVCFSLNKSTSYLSLCVSLNSVCNETSRTWASLSPETKCVISVWNHKGSSPKLGFSQVQVWAHGFKSQSEVNGFSNNRLLDQLIRKNNFGPRKRVNTLAQTPNSWGGLRRLVIKSRILTSLQGALGFPS